MYCEESCQASLISINEKILSYMYQKNLRYRDSKRDTDVQNRLLDSVGEGEGGMLWENGTETYMYKKRTA